MRSFLSGLAAGLTAGLMIGFFVPSGSTVGRDEERQVGTAEPLAPAVEGAGLESPAVGPPEAVGERAERRSAVGEAAELPEASDAGDGLAEAPVVEVGLPAAGAVEVGLPAAGAVEVGLPAAGAVEVGLPAAAGLSGGSPSSAHGEAAPPWTVWSDGSRLFRVPAGVSRLPGRPRHEAFYVAPRRVTNAQFRAFVEARSPGGIEEWSAAAARNGEAAAAVFVPCDLAMAYAEWAGLRLPSEAEWHAANDAGPFVEEADRLWEWTSTWYDRLPGHSAHDRHYGTEYKVMLSTFDSSRNFYRPDACSRDIGFRCVCDVPVLEEARLMR
jgi:hypothetical protein